MFVFFEVSNLFEQTEEGHYVIVQYRTDTPGIALYADFSHHQ